MEKFADLERGFERLLGEYQQLVGKQVAQTKHIDHLHFMITGKSYPKEKRFCKDCGMVIVGDEEHECRAKQ
jgi:hypothetical protein